jgi:hypothetical protein
MPDEVLEDGQTIKAIDDYFRSGDVEANLTLARNLLQANTTLDAIIEALPSAKRSPAFVHPVPDSPLKGPKLASALREGYLDAIDRALSHSPPVPIKSIWRTGNNTEFTTSVADQGSRVIMTLVIPRDIVKPSDLRKYRTL